MQKVRDWQRQKRLGPKSIQTIADFLGVPFETVLGFGECAWSASWQKFNAGKPDGDGRVRNRDLPLLREINPVAMIESYGGFSGGSPDPDSLRGFGATCHTYLGFDPITGIEYCTDDNGGGPRIRRGDEKWQWIRR